MSSGSRGALAARTAPPAHALPATQDIKPIVDAVHGAERPVLYVGGGCLDAAPELREFVAQTGIPVAQTLMGLGAFPESDPLALQARREPGLCFVRLIRSGRCTCWFPEHCGRPCSMPGASVPQRGTAEYCAA